MRVLITGATGFLGYHITKACLDAGHDVLCLRRSTSKNPFSPEYADRITWFELDAADATNVVASFAPDALIHAAWEGLGLSNRNDQEVQKKNIILLKSLVELYSFPQLIILGSMEEYGYPGIVMTEATPVSPFSAYTRAKIECLQYLQEYASSRQIVWQWIRVFSVYGTHQQEGWLIPSLIRQCKRKETHIHTTRGEQSYSFLWAEDFGRAICSVIGCPRNTSGIYNLSSRNPVHLRDVFDLIRRLTNYPGEFVKDLPYRGNGNLVVLGDSSKFVRCFGEYESISLKEGLNRLIHLL